MITPEELTRYSEKPKTVQHLSTKDVLMIRTLIRAKGKLSTLDMSRKLGLPLTTIQRRRKWLENVFINSSYSVIPQGFGYKAVTIDLGTGEGRTGEIVAKLQAIPNIIKVIKVLSGGNCNLRATTYVRNSAELVAILDGIRQFEGVNSLSWVEEIGVIAENDVLDLIFPEDLSALTRMELDIKLDNDNLEEKPVEAE